MDSKKYELFLRCFPEFPMTEETFRKLLNAENCRFFTYLENGSELGFSAVSGNKIRLICVDPDHRGKGIGSDLLDQSEKYIISSGFDKAILGGTDSNLFIGAVTPEEQWNDMHCTYFEKRGYTASNGCMEMEMSLSDFSESNTPEYPSDVTFGYCPDSRRSELWGSVRKVDEEWLQYFKTESPVFIAERNGQIVGFCVVDVNADTIISSGNVNVGMIGCVGVIPEARRNGIGLAMVAKAMSDVKKRGCGKVFIHYTHLDWWYGRLGFRTFLRYWFGEKKLA